MDLAVWVQQQLVANGAVTFTIRNGVEEPIDGEELTEELNRRLAGLAIRSRLTVRSNPPLEVLPPRRDWWLRWLGGRGAPPIRKVKVFGWFFNLPESKRRLPQTALVKEYQKTGLPGSVSTITTAIAEAKVIDKGPPENRY